ncbi:MAG TPA: dipeptidase [Solirubrobacteraceae bacterium]|jgi:membrane dipeptidase|nr:dipeptidase [Solirubrobacteraceae bacterium]
MVAVFDGHNDALTREDHARIASGRDGGHLDLPRMRVGGVRGAIFAVFTSSAAFDWTPVERADGVVEIALAEPVPHPEAAAYAAAAAGRLAALERAGEVRIVRTIADLDAAGRDDGPPAAVLHLEGAEAIDPELEALELWHAAGLRSLGPVWSRSNQFGHGVPFIFPSGPDTGDGLTAAGRGLVRRCGELGILVDLSHLNEAGFWDVARAEAGPLVASHSGAHALCAASRNLTDEQLDAIAASGGMVGIVYVCQFLRGDFADDADTPLELIAQHAAYVAERIGVAHVGLGSDFDGGTIPAALGDVAGVPKVLDALREVGFTADEVAAIAWDNWRRVLDAWWS